MTPRRAASARRARRKPDHHDLPPFKNTPPTDFSAPENRRALQEALARVKAELGREYRLVIGGDR
ncbi:MAG: hypothetical protein HYY34_07215, partial [Chloroflexi bacterium]|nr:hypothetical protein [Chloroflexota bacterium]